MSVTDFKATESETIFGQPYIQTKVTIKSTSLHVCFGYETVAHRRQWKMVVKCRGLTEVNYYNC